MSQTNHGITIHVVFSTKLRSPVLHDDWRDELFAYIGGTVREHKAVLLAAGGIEDHVHLLLKIHPSFAIADTIRHLKANSSRWINEQRKMPARFEWQRGYGAFSVSHSMLDRVRAYIHKQREHHARMSFRDEYLVILRRHEINSTKGTSLTKRLWIDRLVLAPLRGSRFRAHTVLGFRCAPPQAKSCRRYAAAACLVRLRLKLHGKKNTVFPVTQGIRFLGYRVFPTHRLLVKDNVRRFRRRVRRMQRQFAKREIDHDDVRRRLMSWSGHAGQADTYLLRRRLFATMGFRRDWDR